MKNTIRYIIGYIIGFTLFILLIPRWLYQISIKDYISFGDHLIDSEILRIALALPVFLIGVVFAIWSNVNLAKFGEGGPVDPFNIPISPRSKHLLTDGPYRYSRNPMVLGAFCLYFSIGLYLNSIRCLMVVAGFLIILTIYVKLFEERRLLKDFGSDYLHYKKRVPMIFPGIRMKKTKKG